MSANGIMSLRMRSAPCEKGSKIGIKRATLSRLNAEMEATLPVLKKADWSSVRKNRETRASERVSERNGEEAREAGTAAVPFVALGVTGLEKLGTGFV